MFAILKGKDGLLEDPLFGLYLESVTGETSPFDIEQVLERHMGVSSCSAIKDLELERLFHSYWEWRDKR